MTYTRGDHLVTGDMLTCLKQGKLVTSGPVLNRFYLQKLNDYPGLIARSTSKRMERGMDSLSEFEI